MEKYLDLWTAKKLGVEALTRQAIEEYQLKKVKETVKRAVEHSPFYKSLYDGISVESWDNFRNLPFTWPEQVREHGMDMVCVGQGEISRIVTMETSGTTAQPKRIYFTARDQELTTDFFHNGMQLLVNQRDTIMILMPCRRPGSIGDLLKEGLERMGAKVIAYGLPNGKDDAKILKQMERGCVTCVVALPSHLAQLAKVSGSYEIHMKNVLLSAEYVGPEHRQRIEAAWNCPIFEHYGMTEMGLGCAVSCGALEGYHIRESDLYLEIIDPATGRVMPDGQEGEIVFTTLTREGMPFIRYRTGDWSRFLPEKCSCGSVLQRLGRVGDRNVLKGAWKGILEKNNCK